MFGSAVLDVAIGIVFVYLLLGLVVSAGTELIASWRNWRGKNLRSGLDHLLSPSLAQKLYEHPLVGKLAKGGRGPSYIPSGMFALALVDVVATAKPADGPPKDLATFLDQVPDPDVRRVLTLLAAEAGADGQRLKESIERWFDLSMDRVAGWYKRKTQGVNAALALAFTLAINADTIVIARALSNDSAVRAGVVAQAKAMAREAPAPSPSGQPGPDPATGEVQRRIAALTGPGLPVGWTGEPGEGFRRWPGWYPGHQGAAAWADTWRDTVRYHLLGWLLTALAASLGAPFWFDMLKKVITVRSAGKVPEAHAPPLGAPAPVPIRRP
jgi:hypothetical protein